MGSLKSQNASHFGIVHKKHQEIVREINDLDRKEETGLLDVGEAQRRVELQDDFWKVIRRNDYILRQKARSKWLSDGDNNTKYFHSIFNQKMRKNALRGLSMASHGWRTHLGLSRKSGVSSQRDSQRRTITGLLWMKYFLLIFLTSRDVVWRRDLKKMISKLLYGNVGRP